MLKINPAMKRVNVLLVLILIAFGSECYSQEIKKETVESNGVENQMTISRSGMYGGTNSEEAKVNFDSAEEYGRNGDLVNAKKYYLKAIKKDKSYVEAYDNLGLVYRRLEEYDKAIEYYKSSIELYPAGRVAHQNLAAVYGIQRDYDSAIKEYEAILEIAPDDPEGYFGMANTYMLLSAFDEALINANKALELYESTNSHHVSDGYYLIGLIYYYQQDNENAKEYLQIAKDKGARIHPQIEDELFTEKDRARDQEFKTKEDYENAETELIEAYDWLRLTLLGVDPTKRKELTAFLMVWMTGSPYVTIELSEKIVTYMDCTDCILIFMGGWTKYVLENGDNDNIVKANLAGTEGVIEFYTLNRTVLGKNKDIEKFIKLKEENKLQGYISSNM